MEYKLIALDMDGTLLNSNKKISKYTEETIKAAISKGKEVVLSTGRCMAELKEYLEQIPEIRYVVGVSGALVYDLKNKHVIYEQPISNEDVAKVFKIADEVDCMKQVLSIESYIDEEKLHQMDKYCMGHYYPLFSTASTTKEDLKKFCLENKPSVYKFNIYHTDGEIRKVTRKKIEKLGLNTVYAEQSSCEVSAPNVSKATGLKMLCEHLNIDINQTIAVGDAENDLEVLSVAGLAVAMGNASEKIKEISDVVVADCDNDGVTEAINKWLLQ